MASFLEAFPHFLLALHPWTEVMCTRWCVPGAIN